MPNYVLVSFIILISVNISFSQYEKRKIGVDRQALAKIVNGKVEALKEDVKLTPKQIIAVKRIYNREVSKIDSLKFLSPEFFEDPQRGREIILSIKHDSEEAINEILTLQQKRTLNQVREAKRKKAFERLNNQQKVRQ